MLISIEIGNCSWVAWIEIVNGFVDEGVVRWKILLVSTEGLQHVTTLRVKNLPLLIRKQWVVIVGVRTSGDLPMQPVFLGGLVDHAPAGFCVIFDSPLTTSILARFNKYIGIYIYKYIYTWIRINYVFCNLLKLNTNLLNMIQHTVL